MCRLFLLLTAFLLTAPLAAQSYEPLLPVKVDGKWGYINLKGEVVIAPAYDRAEDFGNRAFAKVMKDGQYTIISRIGTIFPEMKFDHIQFLNDTLLAVNQDGRWGVRSLTNRTILPCRYKRVLLANDDRHILFKADSLYGLADENGNEAVPPQYDSAAVSHGAYMLFLERYQGLQLKDGQTLILPKYIWLYHPSPDRIFIQNKEAKWACLNLKGDTLLPFRYSGYKYLGPNFCLVQDGNKTLLWLLTEKKLFSDKEVPDASLLNDSLLKVETNDGLSILNAKGQWMSQRGYETIEWHDGFLRTRLNGLYGLNIPDGSEIFQPMFSTIGSIQGNVALVRDDTWWGMINTWGDVILKTEWQEIDVASGTAKAKRGQERTVVELDDAGRVQERSKYDNVLSLRVNYRYDNGWDPNRRNLSSRTTGQTPQANWFRDFKKQRWGYVDDNGDTLIPPFFADVQVYPALGVALVSITVKRTVPAGSGNWTSLDYKRYGIFEDSLKKVTIWPKYDYIDMVHFFSKGFAWTRAIAQGGRFVQVYRNGTVGQEQYTFIDTPSEGRVRFYKFGEIKGCSFNCGENIIATQSAFYNNLYSNRFASLRTGNGWMYVEGGRWGYLDSLGTVVIAPVFEYARSFSRGRGIVMQNKRYGVLSPQGDTLLPLQFSSIDYLPRSRDSLLLLSVVNNRFGFIGEDGLMRCPTRFAKITAVQEGKAAYTHNGLFGFVSTAGDSLIPPQYRQVRPFCEGVAAVRSKRSWVFVREDGEEIVKGNFLEVGDFQHGLAWAKSRGSTGYLDASGQWVIQPKFSYAGDFTSEGLAIVKNAKRKYGIIDREGKMVVPFQYEYIYDYSEGFAVAETGNGWHILNSRGEVVARRRRIRKMQSFSEGRALFMRGNRYGFVDTTGKIVLSGLKGPMGSFHEGFAVFGRAGKRGLIDMSGKVVLYNRHDIISPVQEGFIIVRTGSTYKYLTVYGENPFDRTFEAAEPFRNGVAWVKEKGLWGLIDKEGLWVAQPQFDVVQPFSDGAAAVKLNRLYGLADLNGNLILEPEYEYIRYNDQLILQVESGDAYGYLARNGQWIWQARE